MGFPRCHAYSFVPIPSVLKTFRLHLPSLVSLIPMNDCCVLRLGHGKGSRGALLYLERFRSGPHQRHMWRKVVALALAVGSASVRAGRRAAARNYCHLQLTLYVPPAGASDPCRAQCARAECDRAQSRELHFASQHTRARAAALTCRAFTARRPHMAYSSRLTQE